MSSYEMKTYLIEAYQKTQIESTTEPLPPYSCMKWWPIWKRLQFWLCCCNCQLDFFLTLFPLLMLLCTDIPSAEHGEQRLHVWDYHHSSVMTYASDIVIQESNGCIVCHHLISCHWYLAICIWLLDNLWVHWVIISLPDISLSNFSMSSTMTDLL